MAKKPVSFPVNDWAPPPKEISPLVSQLKNHQFDVVDHINLVSMTNRMMQKYNAPPQRVKEYAQVLKSNKIPRQSVIPLETVVDLLQHKFGTDKRFLEFIPHMTWLLVKTRIGDELQPELAVDLMQEYLDNI